MKQAKNNLINNILQGHKAVKNSPAQYTTLCATGSEQAQRFEALEFLVNNDSELSIEVRAVIELMLLSGCRISQAISVTSKQILNNGAIRIIGSKGSNDKIIFVHKFKSFWLRNKQNISNLLSVYSRFYFYRLFVKKGIFITLPGKINKNVTHSVRQLFIESLQTNEIDNELIKETVGHKNIKSQEFYKRKK